MSELRITQVSFRRKFNLGNYETLDIELTSTIGPEDNCQEVIKLLDRETKKYMRKRED